MSDRQETVWEPWQMGSFDRPVKQPATTPRKLAEKPAGQLLEALQQQARQEHEKAIADGYAQGHSQGLEEGKKTGLAQGFREGHHQGLTQGMTEAQAAAKTEAAKITALFDSYAIAFSRLEEEVGQQLIALAIQIAQQVVRSTLDIHPERLQDLIDDILHHHSSDNTLLRLHIHPEDMDVIATYMQHLQSNHEKTWQLVPDPTVQRGGCVAETAFGEIDASLESRWNRVIASLGHTAP